jgi:hypothetical protein
MQQRVIRVVLANYEIRIAVVALVLVDVMDLDPFRQWSADCDLSDFDVEIFVAVHD